MDSIPWTSGFTGRETVPTIRFHWLRASWWCASHTPLIEGPPEYGESSGLRFEREPAQAGGNGPRLLRARGQAARDGMGPRGALPARGGRAARRARIAGHDRSGGHGGGGVGHGLRRL